jgi:outer membrane lipoprotein-sorting protein
MSDTLSKEFSFYLANQEAMVEKYDGKYIVIHDGNVVGVYDDDLTAVMETQKSLQIGTFLVQKVSEGDTDYTQTFFTFRYPSQADIDFVEEARR